MITAQHIQSRVRDLLLGTPDYPMVRADSSPVIAQTTLTATANPGAQSVSLAGIAADTPSAWTRGSGVRFADASGERTLYVADSWTGGNPVPLDFTNRGFSGLQHAHTSGTPVYTGLFDFAPGTLAQSLVTGCPVIFIHTRRMPTRALGLADINTATVTLVLQYLRQLTPNEDAGVRGNANAFWEDQQIATHEDMALINDALLGNEELIGLNDTALAEQMAPLNSQGDKTLLTFEPVPGKGSAWHFVATLIATYGLVTQPGY